MPLRRRDLLFGLGGLALSGAKAARAAPGVIKADGILVLKAARTLHLLQHRASVATYPIALGAHPIGPKRRAGDSRTPEGHYRIDGRNPDSPYHLALHISYPNAADAARARAARRDPGGNICLHGLPDGYEALDPAAWNVDWTRGCIAVSDRAIEEIWARVDDGTPIEIRP